MDRRSTLETLKAEIEADLRAATDPEDNGFHLRALDAVEFLLDQYL